MYTFCEYKHAAAFKEEKFVGNRKIYYNEAIECHIPTYAQTQCCPKEKQTQIKYTFSEKNLRLRFVSIAARCDDSILAVSPHHSALNFSQALASHARIGITDFTAASHISL